MSPDAPTPPHATETEAEVEATYQRRLDELDAESAILERRDRRLSLARGLSFLGAAGLGLVAAFEHQAAWWVGAGAFAGGFVLFVALHAAVSSRQFDVGRRQLLCRQGLARMDGSFRVPAGQERRRGDAFVDADHDYVADLDVFGPNSLFEQLNTTHTWPGEATLASWLREPAPASTVAARQGAVQELSGQPLLREELRLAAMRAAGEPADTRSILAWAARTAPPRFARPPRLVAAAALNASTVGLLVWQMATGASWAQLWLLGAALQLGLHLAWRRSVEPVVGPVAGRSYPLGRYHVLMARLESERFTDGHLQSLQGQLRSCTGRRASAELRRLETLVSLTAVRHNALLYVPAIALVSWELWCGVLLARWRRRAGAELGRWLDALGQLEALAALATFAHEHPHGAWPTVRPGPGQLRAQDLGHPLIGPRRRVVNDVRLDGSPAAWMVTGSNMSGKSTLLRAVGLNAVLAQAGAPACASELVLSELRVCSSMRLDDSLAEGVSRFYREILRLKRVLDRVAEPGPPVLFLLDEILHGTNSRERTIGAKAVVKQLVRAGAIGLVSSHDLGLTSLEQETAGLVQNAHFTDRLEAGQMVFDYRLKPGPVGTPNALRLMRQVGIPIELDTPSGPREPQREVDGRAPRG